jgi:hypothetical protein
MRRAQITFSRDVGAQHLEVIIGRTRLIRLNEYYSSSLSDLG